MLPALKSSTSACPFDVGPVGLATTKTYKVVSAPRSYLTPRASTLADNYVIMSQLLHMFEDDYTNG
jgi:hypothetical protein